MARIDPEDFEFLRAVIEIRYPKAHKYWDVSGGLVEAIEGRIHGLTCQELAADGFKFVGAPGVGLTSAVFFWDKIIVIQETADSASKFTAAAQEFWNLVHQALSTTAPSRFGHRVWSDIGNRNRYRGGGLATRSADLGVQSGADRRVRNANGEWYRPQDEDC